MDDRIAEIREAAEHFERSLPASSETSAYGHAVRVLVAAARAHVDLLDSDALIIRRDEEGAWPLWAVMAMRHGSEELDYLYEAASSQGVEP